jgi:hypothetical protein
MNKLDKQIRDTFTFAACKHTEENFEGLIIYCEKRKVVLHHLYFGDKYCKTCKLFDCNDIDYWAEELKYHEAAI